jgi:two-component system chemotaxis response regulator CheY
MRLDQPNTEQPGLETLKGVRVLVVDDNAALRGLLRVSLQAFGCQCVLEAASVDRALDHLDSSPVDLIITDWKMSPRDGLDLVQTIRKPLVNSYSRVPVVMLTAYSDTVRMRDARDAGVNEFLVKPFTAERLARALICALGETREFITTDDFFGPDRRSVPRAPSSKNDLDIAAHR